MFFYVFKSKSCEVGLDNFNSLLSQKQSFQALVDQYWLSPQQTTDRSCVEVEFFKDARMTTDICSVERLDILNLYRTALLIESLTLKSTRQQLSQIILSDLSNLKTELGGVILWQDNQAVFKELPALIEGGDDGYWLKFWGGGVPAIASFHLHAQKIDHIEGSNPSVQDLTAGAYRNAIDVLITPISQSESSIKANIDIYYIGKYSANPIYFFLIN